MSKTGQPQEVRSQNSLSRLKGEIVLCTEITG